MDVAEDVESTKVARVGLDIAAVPEHRKCEKKHDAAEEGDQDPLWRCAGDGNLSMCWKCRDKSF